MPHQTKLLLDQAQSLNRAGDWSAAVSLCEEAFAASSADGDSRLLIEAVLRMGLCYHDMGDVEVAEEQLVLAVELAQLAKDAGLTSRSMNALATHCYKHGDYDLAESLYHKARALAVAAGELLTAGDINSNLGILANVRGNNAIALQQYHSALQLYKLVNDKQRTARTLNNLAIVHKDQREFDAATRCIEHGLELSKAAGDIVTEGVLLTNLTEILLEQDLLERARSTCDQAYELSSRLKEAGMRAEALRFYGIIYRRTEKPHLAEAHLRQATEIAAEAQLPLLQADAQRELALVFRGQDRNREALDALNKAHALFTHLRVAQGQEDIRERVEQLERDFLAVVRTWGESIEAKDQYTRGHCQRVADYACTIAEEAGFPAGELPWFRMGAFLHDVGKTGIAGEILNKPGRLTEEERALIDQHTILGDEMLATIAFPWDVRPMVRSHHERWDGKGYPDKLAGEAIPLTARILHIADVFDALTTTRSYRQPLTPEEALQEMERDADSFDPTLFLLFKQLLATNRLLILSDERRQRH